MKKTLGGDRLGSGKQMKVELHGYERSTHDMGYLWRSTMSAGTLVPFISEPALPGDTFDINLDCDIKTHPTVGPLFGSYKIQLDVFQAPVRLYQAQLHNNKLGIGMEMSTIKLPQIRLTATPVTGATNDTIDNWQINPSCILSYLNIRGVGSIPATVTAGAERQRDFNGLSFLAYWDIYKNYYANKQEEIGAVIHNARAAITEEVGGVEIDAIGLSQAPAIDNNIVLDEVTIVIDWAAATPIVWDEIVFNTSNGQISLLEISIPGSVHDVGVQTLSVYDYGRWGNIIFNNWNYITADQIPIGPPQVATFDLNNIDKMREEILKFIDTDPFIVNVTPAVPLTPYIWPINFTGAGLINPMLSTQEGLAIKTYQSDLFNNWLSTEWIDGAGGISEVTAIDTSGGSFSIDTLNLSKKVYDMLNRIAVSGGSYDDWLDAVYAHDRYQRCETPMYMGGLIKELIFQEVVSNSESQGANGSQPLGTLAGKGVMSKKHKGGKITIKVDEPSYIIGIISLTPRIDYSQGNKWDTQLKTMDDFHKPALDEIGFQELIEEQMAWWTTQKPNDAGTWETKSAGKQPAWINYMTNVNQTRGNFAIRDNEMFMTLNRRYEYDGPENIEDLTTYIDPVKFNNIFAQTNLDAQNFWAQIAVDITARRKMSAKIMPNL